MGVVGSFINLASPDLEPGELLVALGVVGGGVDFAPPDLKPRGVIVVFAFRITRRGIELVPFDFEPGHRIASDWVVWRLIDLAHALTFGRPGFSRYFFFKNFCIFLFTDSRPV